MTSQPDDDVTAGDPRAGGRVPAWPVLVGMMAVAKCSVNRGATEAARMKQVAFLTRKLNRCMPTEARQMAEYEAKHGPVGA